MSMNDAEIISNLKKIVDSQGADVFSNHAKATALISDYFPGSENVKTRRLIKSIIDVDAFAKVSKADDSNLDSVCKALKAILVDQESLSDDRAETSLIWVCEALGKKKPNFPKAAPVISQTTSSLSGSYTSGSQSSVQPRTATVPAPNNSNNTYGLDLSYHVKRKRHINTKLIGGVAAVALIAALFGFVIWPKMIQPNMDDENLYTPEIVQSYCESDDRQDNILTITECTEDGLVKATWEFITDDNKYGKVNLTGKIVEKKNNGDVVIEWTDNSQEIMPEGSRWTDEESITISQKWTIAKTDDHTFTAGVNEKYEIKTADDFKKLINSDGTYQLKNDIDIEGINWTPIEGFSGTLFGNGFTIKNLAIDASSSNVGLFSTLSGSVDNLNIENASITVSGRNENVGILCGEFLKGSIINISVSGTVNASKCTNVGGISGSASRSITSDLNLSYLTNSASVSGLSNVGGIAGYIFANSIDETFDSLKNSGSINAGEDYVGGIVGRMDADTVMTSHPHVKIYDCENTGDVCGRYYVGGINGYVKSGSSEESAISGSICRANITGEAYVGCIFGMSISVPVDNCQNEGSTLTANGSITEGDERCAYVGGFVGCGSGEVSNCTNEVEIKYTGSGNYVGGVIGYAARYISPSHFNFKNVANNAPVSGANYVGGVAGYLYCEYIPMQIEAATNSADVTGSGDYVGGIAGFCQAYSSNGSLNIYDSVNSGNILGKNYVGGIVGFAKANAKPSVISDCSSSGTVSGESNADNIAGELDNIEIE